MNLSPRAMSGAASSFGISLQLRWIEGRGLSAGRRRLSIALHLSRDVGYVPHYFADGHGLGNCLGDLDYIPRFGASPLLSETENMSSVSHFSRILSSQVTKIINVPVMSDSGATGLAGCLYNVTLPNIDNWRRFTQYGTLGASGIAEIYSDPVIKDKVVLNIMDGLLAGYADGPASHPNYAVRSRDVACQP